MKRFEKILGFGGHHWLYTNFPTVLTIKILKRLLQYNPESWLSLKWFSRTRNLNEIGAFRFTELLKKTVLKNVQIYAKLLVLNGKFKKNYCDEKRNLSTTRLCTINNGILKWFGLISGYDDFKPEVCCRSMKVLCSRSKKKPSNSLQSTPVRIKFIINVLSLQKCFRKCIATTWYQSSYQPLNTKIL